LWQTHDHFLGAVRLGLSGQLPGACALLRLSLESALYGLYVAGNSNRQEIWAKRHDDNSSRRHSKKEFTVRKIMDHLRSVDAKTQGIVDQLYQRTIDYGGHPNPRAVLPGIEIEESGRTTNFSMDHFQCGDVRQMACLKLAAQVGICSLDVLYHVQPA